MSTAVESSESAWPQFERVAPMVKRIRDIGSASQVSGLTPFLLDDPSAVWYVENGKVEVFTVAVEDGEPKGARVNFTSILPGELLFGMDLEAYAMGSGFLAVGKLGTTIVRLSIEHLIEAAADPLIGPDLARAVDIWVSKFSRALTKDIVPIPLANHNMASGESLELENGKRARATQGVHWLRAERGDLVYVGLESLGLQNREILFPLTPDSWVEAANRGGNNTLIKAEAAAATVTEPAFWEGLRAFHEVLCTCEFINKKLALVDEYNRLSSKAEHTENARADAYREIYAVMAQPTRRKLAIEPVEGEHPFSAAVRLVCGAMNIKAKPIKGLERFTKIEDRIQIASRGVRCRFRQVALRDDWWAHDHGPILAQVDETSAPVALLPTSPKSYEYIETQTGARGPVTPAFADKLTPFGAVFYRSFPDGPMDWKKLIKFGSFGLGYDYLWLLAAGMMVGALGALTPIFTGQIFDMVIPQSERMMLYQITFGMLAAAAATVVFNLVQQTAALRIQGKMDYSIQAAVWDRILNLPSTFFADYSSGDLAARAMGINQIRQLVASAGVSAMLGTVTSIFYVVLLFVYSFKLAMVAMGLVATFVIFQFTMSYIQIRQQREILRVNGSISGLVLSLLSGVAKLRTTGAEAHAFKVWAKLFADVRRLTFGNGETQNWVVVFNASFPLLSSITLFATMTFFAGEGESRLTTGQFIAFNAAYGAFLAAMVALSEASLNLFRAVPLYERLKPILQAEAEIDESKESPGEISGEIEVSHIHFRYTEDGPWILKDVSLKIKAGEMIAFVGGSGSGKSTLMRCIVGFEKPEKGSIYYDGKDLSTLDLREIRQQMGVVLQDSQLLPTDIFRNIVGTSSKTVEEAWEAARKVGLDQDIKAMPMGMHTYVMEGGGGFSGGQKQRLLLARSVVNNPRIIILDEATSALDNKTQAQVTASMERMQATRIVIAHRLSTIVNADRICYLDKGVLAEIGTYKELMDKKGLFYELARRQLA